MHERTVVGFVSCWKELVSKYPKAAEYMNSSHWPTRQHWASCYTDEYTTFGAYSTQRVESINSLIKHFIRPSFPLTELFKTITSISERQEQQLQQRLEQDASISGDFDSRVYQDARTVLTRQAAALLHYESINKEDYQVTWYDSKPVGGWEANRGYTSVINSTVVPPVVQSVTDIIDSDISSVVHSSVVHSVMDSVVNSIKADHGGYLVINIRSSNRLPHWVTVSNNDASCSDCHFAGKYLLPCRHIQAVNLKVFQKAFQAMQCHPRWRLEAADTATLPCAEEVKDDELNPIVRWDDMPNIGEFIIQQSRNQKYINLRATFDRMCYMMDSASDEKWKEVNDYMVSVGKSLSAKVRYAAHVHSRALQSNVS